MSIVEKAHRTTVAAGLLGLGIFVGMVAVRPGPVAADDAGLAAQVAALAQRIDALEAAKDKPQTLKAPFSVVDGAGKEVLHVDSQGGRGILALLGSPGSIWLRAGEDLSIDAANSTGSASIAIDGEGASVKVGDTSASVMIGSKGGNPVVQGQLGSEPVIDFTTAEGGPKLTVGTGGNKVEITGLESQTGVSVDAAGFNYLMGYYSNVSGFIASQGTQPIAALGSSGDAKFKVAIYNSGKPAFIAGNNGHSTGMFVHDPSGKEIANIDSTGATGGRLQLLGPGGNEIAAIGTPKGGGDGGALSLTQGGNKVNLGFGYGSAGPSLAFTDGSEESFAVKNDGDGGKLSLGKGDRKVVMRTSGGESIFQAYSGSRTTQMGIGKKSAGFVIGDDAKPLAALADNLDGKPFLGIYGGGASGALLAAGYQPSGKLAFRIGEAAKPTAILQESAKSAGELNLYGPGGGELAVNLGIGDSGAAGLRLSAAGHQGAVLAAKPDGGGAMRILNGGVTVASVESTGDDASISVFSGGKERASLVKRGATGGVVLWGSSGSPLVRLVEGGAGGSMVVSDGSGGDVLEARADPSVGGIVCVNYKNVEKCLGRGLTGMEGFH